MCKKHPQKTNVLKSDVCQLFAALKTGKQYIVYVFSIQIIICLIQKGRLPVLGWILANASPPPKKKWWGGGLTVIFLYLDTNVLTRHF